MPFALASDLLGGRSCDTTVNVHRSGAAIVETGQCKLFLFVLDKGQVSEF